MNKIQILTFSVLCLILASCSTGEVPQLGKASLDKVIKAMTLEEKVQLYVTAPDAVAMNKPEKELKAFAKTKELQPGETQTLVMTVDRYDLASYDEAQVAWVVDEGEYNFLLGASSRDIRASVSSPVKAAKYPTNDVLKLPEDIELLKR